MALNADQLTAAEAAAAKFWCTELQNKVADKCLQLFGGYGYMSEYPIARTFADARITTIYGGTAPYSVNNSNSAVVTTTPTGSLGAGVVKFSIIAKTVGVATVAISDANGNVVTIAVTVTNGIVTDAPANLTLVSGTGNTFAVFGGTPFAGPPPTYSVNSSDTTVASAVFTGSSCLLYTSPSPRDRTRSRMPSSA